MLTPEYLRNIAEGAEEISSELHSYIIRRIVDRMMTRIGRGEEYLFTSADRWQIEIMQDSGALLEDIIPEIAKYTKREQKEIKAAMEEAGIKAVEQDDKIYEAAGLSPVPLLESPQLIRLMQRTMTQPWASGIITPARPQTLHSGFLSTRAIPLTIKSQAALYRTHRRSERRLMRWCLAVCM